MSQNNYLSAASPARIANSDYHMVQDNINQLQLNQQRADMWQQALTNSQYETQHKKDNSTIIKSAIQNTIA